MCRNIKHAFYQPAENEMICLVHFHLINPIMVSKKKTQDVQCFAEVMDSVQTLDAGRRSMYDPDEIEEEQRERDQRNKVLHQFGLLAIGLSLLPSSQQLYTTLHDGSFRCS